MDIEGRVLKSDRVGRVFFTASPADIDKIYHDRLTFWRDRHGAMAHAEIREQAIAGQGKNYNHGMKKPLGAALEAMCRNASPDRIPSILELGGADGITLRHLRDKIPDFRARYVGIEPCSVFVDHFKAQFPDAHVIVGDAAKLIKMPIKWFSDAPYRAFVASLSLCMIKPEVVRKVLSRAARLCEELLLIDFLGNIKGEISASEPVMFLFGEHKRIVFAHTFAEYILSAGFRKIVVTEEPNLISEHMNWGLIHAKK